MAIAARRTHYADNGLHPGRKNGLQRLLAGLRNDASWAAGGVGPYKGTEKNFPRLPGGRSRLCRAGPVTTCTKEQVGRLSSVSLLPTSGQSREACNPQIQIGIPYKRCGFHEPQVHRDKHAHRRALFLFSQRIRGGRGDYSLPSSSSSSSKSRTMKCSYTSLSWSSSSMDSNSSSPFSSSTERRMMMP